MCTADGMYRLGLDGWSTIQHWDLLNGSAPELIAQDSVNGELYWVEQGTGNGTARIHRHEAISGKISLALEVQFNKSRHGPQGKAQKAPLSDVLVVIMKSSFVWDLIPLLFPSSNSSHGRGLVNSKYLLYNPT